jgi:carboxyl-terminal processing protease
LRLTAAFLLTTVALAATPTLSTEQRRLNIESFEHIWKTVRDKHWDPKLGGLDWQAVHDELLPRVEAARTMDEAREVERTMLERLHQTHFGIIPNDAYDPGGSDKSESVQGETGIHLRILSGHAIVWDVDGESAAHEAGVLKGWEIVRIDKTDIPQLIARLENAGTHSRLSELLTSRAIRNRLDGPAGSEVSVEFSDIAGKQMSRKIFRRAESGEMTQFGFLPPMAVRFESRKLQGGEEYIRFNIFLKPDMIVPRFGEAIRDCGHCPGIIIDLRGNPGGIGAMAMGMAGFLISQPDQKLGTMYMRTLPIRFVIFPRPEVYSGPVAILVDGFTASTSEIFAGGLQDLKRARTFGERTAGAALPSQIERLPNGDGFQYAMANYISESGLQLEGHGVTPDVVVPLDRKALAEGRDAVVEAAIKWFQSGK